jgi:hypothetical protein
MTTVEFITALFSGVDEQMGATSTPPEAHLWPSEVVILGLLHALTGVGNRACSRRVTRDSRALLPRLPARTRLVRLDTTQPDWPQVFLAAPTVLGVINTSGGELIRPRREGRRTPQVGRTGLSNHRWMVGSPWCRLLHQWGLMVGWACATAQVADTTVQWCMRQAVDGRRHALQHGIEESPGLFRITIGQQFHRALEVGKQHRDLLALAFQGAAGSQDLLGEIRRGVGQGCRGGRYGCGSSRCSSLSDPDQHFPVLIGSEPLALDQFDAQVLQCGGVELKLPLERAIGHPPPLA